MTATAAATTAIFPPLALPTLPLNPTPQPIAVARDFYAKAVCATHEMAHQLIVELKRRGVEVVVAPYEADAQLAFLARTNNCQVSRHPPPTQHSFHSPTRPLTYPPAAPPSFSPPITSIHVYHIPRYALIPRRW